MPTFYKTINEALADPMCSDIFYVGNKNCYKIYHLEDVQGKEIPDFIKEIKKTPSHEVFKTFEEAIDKVEDSTYVGIGYPKSQLVYRVNKKNYTGDIQDKDNLNGCFQFVYHFNG